MSAPLSRPHRLWEFPPSLTGCWNRWVKSTSNRRDPRWYGWGPLSRIGPSGSRRTGSYGPGSCAVAGLPWSRAASRTAGTRARILLFLSSVVRGAGADPGRDPLDLIGREIGAAERHPLPREARIAAQLQDHVAVIGIPRRDAVERAVLSRRMADQIAVALDGLQHQPGRRRAGGVAPRLGADRREDLRLDLREGERRHAAGGRRRGLGGALYRAATVQQQGQQQGQDHEATGRSRTHRRPAPGERTG